MAIFSALTHPKGSCIQQAYAHENNCPLDENTTYIADLNGYLDLLVYGKQIILVIMNVSDKNRLIPFYSSFINKEHHYYGCYFSKILFQKKRRLKQIEYHLLSVFANQKSNHNLRLTVLYNTSKLI